MYGLGVGGAAASGLQAGFDMGLRATAQDDARKQREFENQRQTTADTERTQQTQRFNARQDKQDAYAEDDRALSGLNTEASDHAIYGAGLAAQYGGVANIPQGEGSAYASKATDISTRRTALLRKRYEPQVKQEQQWAQDTASRIQAGQMSMDDLSPADTVRLIQATSRRPVSDFLAPPNGKSKVGQGIADVEAGMQTGNQSLTIDGAGNLLSPELQVGLGHTAPDGSQIVGKSLYALVPAPQMGQPQQAQVNPIQGLTAAMNAATGATGAQPPQPSQQAQPSDQQPPQSDQQQPAGSGTLMPSQTPGKVLPVLQVTARHPDGTEVTYHAPVTQGRGAGASDTISGPLDMGEAMDRMGKMGVLEKWANTPQARAKIEQGVKELGGDSNSFLSAYYAMHGDARALLPAGSADPTGVKIASIRKLADEQYGGDFTAAAQALTGKVNGVPSSSGVAGALATSTPAAAAPTAAPATGVSGRVIPAATQQARDNDALAVLQTERGAIQARLDAATKSGDTTAAQRAQGDLGEINKEIAGAAKKGGVTEAQQATTPTVALKHGAAGLSPQQNAALFGPKGAVTEGRLDMARVNSRTASLLADAELTNPGTDFAAKSGDIQLARNATFRQKAIIAESLPEIMQNMVTAGKKVNFSNIEPIGQMQAWVEGKTNDPDLTSYMTQRNDALMTIAGVMRGVGMTDKAHQAEIEVAKPTMSPRALDAWYDAQMKSLAPRLRMNRQITHSEAGQAGRGTGLPAPGGAPTPPAVGTVMQGYRFKGGDPAQQTSWERAP
jgi:hypothetical protein